MKKTILLLSAIAINLISIKGQVNNGLIHWMHFNGGVNDSIGNLSGTIHGATADTGKGGVSNTAYFFDGVNDYIDYGTVDPTDSAKDISVCIQFKPSTKVVPNDTTKLNPLLNNEYLISSGGQSSSTGFAVYWSKGPIEVQRKYTGQAIKSGYKGYADNDWHLVCFTHDYSSNKMKVYLDGRLISDTTGNTGTYTNIYKELYVGVPSWFKKQYYFHGLIDDIKIYDRVLSSLDIDSLVNPLLTTGIQKRHFSNNFNWSVHPNPFANHISIETNGAVLNKPIEVKLFSLTGKEILSRFLTTNRERLDLEHLESGVYILRINEEKQQRNIRLIKK